MSVVDGSLGPGCRKERFGGEGEGWKIFRDLDWEIGEDVKFEVVLRKVDSSEESGTQTTDSNTTVNTAIANGSGAKSNQNPLYGPFHLSASLSRNGKLPAEHLGTFYLPAQSKVQHPIKDFIGFIEDWDRRAEATGCDQARSAVFHSPVWTLGAASGENAGSDGSGKPVEFPLDSIMFTKVESGAERAGSRKCCGAELVEMDLNVQANHQGNTGLNGKDTTGDGGANASHPDSSSEKSVGVMMTTGGCGGLVTPNNTVLWKRGP